MKYVILYPLFLTIVNHFYKWSCHHHEDMEFTKHSLN